MTEICYRVDEINTFYCGQRYNFNSVEYEVLQRERQGFPHPVQTGPGTHPASCAMGTVSFLYVKRPERGVDHPSPSSAEFKENVETYIYSSLSGPSWPLLG